MMQLEYILVDIYPTAEPQKSLYSCFLQAVYIVTKLTSLKLTDLPYYTDKTYKCKIPSFVTNSLLSF